MNYSILSKAKLQTILSEKNTSLDMDFIRSLKKSELIEQIKASENPLDNATPVEEGSTTTTATEQKAKVNRNQLGWTKFILSDLDTSELMKGRPTANGLRRMLEKHVGPIISTNVQVVQTPTPENERRASVVYTMTYFDGELNHERTISDAADCYYGNSSEPYVRHTVATATSMAEGRCLRKALRLNIVTAEETLETDQNEIDLAESLQPAKDSQKIAIENMCVKLGINCAAMITYFEPDRKMNMDILSYKDAQFILNNLVAYSRGPDKGGKIIPEEILVKVPK